MKLLGNVARYLMFLPLCLTLFVISAISVVYMMGWVTQFLFWSSERLGVFLFVFLIIFFLGTLISLYGQIIRLITWIASIFLLLSSKISPSKENATIIVALFSIANGVFLIYKAWTIDVRYSGGMIFLAIIFSLEIVHLTFSFIRTSLILSGYYEKRTL